MKKTILVVLVGLSIFLTSCESNVENLSVNQESLVSQSNPQRVVAAVVRLSEGTFSITVGGELTGIIYPISTTNYAKYSKFSFVITQVPSSYTGTFYVRGYDSSGNIIPDDALHINIPKTGATSYALSVMKSSLPSNCKRLKLIAESGTYGYYGVSGQ